MLTPALELLPPEAHQSPTHLIFRRGLKLVLCKWEFFFYFSDCFSVPFLNYGFLKNDFIMDFIVFKC